MKSTNNSRWTVSRAIVCFASGLLLSLALIISVPGAGNAGPSEFAQAVQADPNKAELSASPVPEPGIGVGTPTEQTVDNPTAAEDMPSERTPYVLARGDTINVKFYKHQDISGEFLVRSDGSISVPLLGTISIAGKSVAEAEATLEVALAALTNRRAYVSVEVSKYRPVYVVGFVERAGSFNWVPDLNVLQAVSLAGGFPRVSEYVAADSDRETGRLTEAAELQSRALVRRERLLAERDGNANLQAPKQLTELVTERKAQEIIEIEQRQLQRNVDIRKSQKANLNRMMALAEEEVGALSQRLEAVNSQIDIQTKMAKKLREMFNKGNTTLKNVTDVESDVARFESERGQLLADLAQAKQRRNTATFDVDKVDAEVTQEIERELADVERDIAKYTTDISTSKTVLKRYGAQPCPTGTRGAEPKVSYEIVRKSESRMETIIVDETALVKPGDTLRVRNIDALCSNGS